MQSRKMELRKQGQRGQFKNPGCVVWEQQQRGSGSGLEAW